MEFKHEVKQNNSTKLAYLVDIKRSHYSP